jgi:hypothetical protein
MSAKLSVEDKYKLYESSVQCVESDVDFINEEFEKLFGRKPQSLREDFGGTAALACEWVKQTADHKAWSIDLDVEPIKYGIENHYSKLNEEQKTRMTYIEGNVLKDHGFRPEVIVAFNFSYFIFKKRKQLLEYFKTVRSSIDKDGVFFLDIFGGSECFQPLVEETEHDDHSYFWDCREYNPITQEALYAIHFKKSDSNRKYRDVFVYDWRHWGLQEVRDILEEAGFSKTIAYWEGEDEDGEGDGNFFITDECENCESWVTYIAALP